MNSEDESNKSFNQALSNFVFGVANKDLICHLADQGYSVRRIKEETDYPVSVEKIAETVWEHYLENGVILLEPPEGSLMEDTGCSSSSGIGGDSAISVNETGNVAGATDSMIKKNKKTEFVMDIGKYGRRSFRQVEVSDSGLEDREYAPVDIGIWKRHDPEKYQDYLSKLDSRKRDYIDGLPWPDARVYHELNLQFREILDMWREENNG
ncbi:MAG: hypothetical protein IJM01_00970 [Eubacterium sp.]|nr:hypothetical protein [Eubacterium sp.]